MTDAKTVLTPETLRALAALLDKAPDPQEQVMDGDDLRAHADAWQARVEALRADIVGVLAFYGPHLHPRVRETLERIALAAGEPQQGPDEA
jgi:hypothetical protein